MKYSRFLSAFGLAAAVLVTAQGCGKGDKSEAPKQFIPPPGPDVKPQAGGAGAGPSTTTPPPAQLPK